MTGQEKIEAIQKILGVVADGVWGKKSQAALNALTNADASSIPPVQIFQAPGDRVDDRSETAIATLHPKVQPFARAFVKLAAAGGVTIKITSGTRTYAEQDALFKKGGVTKARGGQSNHNFGIAIDITIFNGKTPVWESPKYKDLGQLGKSLGFEWGGDWKSFKDEPHFQLRPPWAKGLSEQQMLSELRSRHNSGIDAFA